MIAVSSTFRSGEPGLPELLKDIDNAKIQLPDFQRSWVWDDERIRSLIASASLSYPVGAVMLLQAGGGGGQFQPRLLEGVPANGRRDPEYLILDGQQRMTAFYLSMFSDKPVKTQTERKEPIERYYYLDMEKCLDLDVDRIDAVLSFPPDRRITVDFGRTVLLDLSTPEREYDQSIFPLSVVFNADRYSAWRREYTKKHRNNEAKLDLFDSFETEVVARLTGYRVPVIELLKDTPKEAVCQVFEKVNTGGVILTVFELMTATYAAENFSLREDWNRRVERLNEYDVLEAVDETSFIVSVTLLSTYYRHAVGEVGAVGCKRRDVLRLKLTDFQQYAGRIESGLLLAARFLAREKIFDTRTLPYSTQLIPLSAICAALGNRFDQEPIRRKLEQWYWCGVFGELYGGANETRFALDLPEFMSWVDGGDVPRTVRDATFSPTRLLSMQSRLSAAYKGLMAHLLKCSAADWMSGDPIELSNYFSLSIDIHHVFPRAYCERLGLPRAKWNSSINKTPLASGTNGLLGGRAPGTYLRLLEEKYGHHPERLDGILRTHLVDPDLLRCNEFDQFILARAGRLLDLVEEAMGKAVSGRDSDEVVLAFGAPII